VVFRCLAARGVAGWSWTRRACVASACAVSIGLPGVVHAQRLPDLYRAALAADPQVQGALSQVRAAEQRLVQAKAGFGPTAVITAGKSQTRYYEAPAFDMRPFSSKQVNLQVTQPVFRPALLAALEQAQFQQEQAQAQWQQSQADAIQRLVEASFDVLKARDALAFLRSQRAATAEQLTAAQRSFRIGTVPITDVREAEAKADTVAAQLAAAEYELDLKQQVVAELTGEPAPGLLRRGLTGEHLPAIEPSSLGDWLNEALAHSAQLRQAQHALGAAGAEVRRAEYGHAPTAELTFTHGLSSESGSVTSSQRRRADSTQVGVNVNIPLFAGFGTQAKVEEAIALKDKAQSEVDAARRNLTLGVRQGFTTTLSAISQARGLDAAVKSSQTALRANQRGYEVGMRVNAEVLDAQTKLYEALRDRSRARYDAWVNYFKLKALAGRLAEADVGELDALLVEVDPMATQGVLPRTGEATR
jgi:outer membrane protein